MAKLGDDHLIFRGEDATQISSKLVAFIHPWRLHDFLKARLVEFIFTPELKFYVRTLTGKGLTPAQRPVILFTIFELTIIISVQAVS